MIRSVSYIIPFRVNVRGDPRKRRSDHQAWASHSSYPNPNEINILMR
jgi:hypothetical protein